MNNAERKIRSMPAKNDDPRFINERALEDTAYALETGDAALLKSWFAMPYTLQTFDATRIVESHAELNRLFESVRTFYQSLGITQIIRETVATSRRGTDEIVVTYETRLLNKTTLMAEPFPSMGVMRWMEGRWMIISTSYGFERENALSRILSSENDEEAMRKTCR